MKKLAVITLALAACNTFAGTDAQNQNDPQSHIYVQIEAGYAQQDFADKMLLASRENSGSAGGALRIGSLRAFDSWSTGMEAGIFSLGEVKYNNALPGVNFEAKQSGFDFLLLAQKKLTDRINLFGKAGLAYVEQENTAVGSVRSIKESGNEVLPEVALGISVNLNKNFELTATGSHIFSKKFDANSSMDTVASSSAVLLGLRYHFS